MSIQPRGAGYYLCGCNIKTKQGYSFSLTGRTDNQGFDVCPEHGQRRYGWRTEVWPAKARPANSDDGRKQPIRVSVKDDRRDMRDPEEIGTALREPDASKNSDSPLAYNPPSSEDGKSAGSV